MKTKSSFKVIYVILFFLNLSYYEQTRASNLVPCNPLVAQFNMTFMAPFSHTVPVIAGDTYYFTVSGVMNFFSGIPCGQWDAYYRFYNPPVQYSPIIGTNFPNNPCPMSYNPSHFYSSCQFTAPSNQLTFTFGDSYYYDNCGTFEISVYRITGIPVVALGNDTSICQGTVITLNAGNPGSSYLWSNNATTQSINVNNPGTYSVTVTNQGGCTGSDTIVVGQYILPAPTITGNSSACVNSGYYYYAANPGMNNYQWSVSPGATIIWGQGLADLIVTWDQPGTQWLAVNYTSPGGCIPISPTQFNVTVNPLPGLAETITGPSMVCAGSTGVIFSTTLISNAVTYVWSLPPGASIASGYGSNTITVDFSPAAQSGTITVYGNNLCGNGSLSPSLTLSVSALPGLAGIPVGLDDVCEGDTGIVYYIPPVFNAASYVWDIQGGGEITAGNGTNSIRAKFPTAPANCQITVYGTNSCGQGTISQVREVTVHSTPETPVITQNGDMLVSSALTGNQWFLNNAIIPNAAQQTYDPVVTGQYSVQVKLEGCHSEMSDSYYYIMTGISSSDSVQMLIWPNPNNGSFRISGIANGFVSIFVINSLGVKVHEQKFSHRSSDGEINIKLEAITTGLYMVMVESGGVTRGLRMVVKGGK